MTTTMYVPELLGVSEAAAWLGLSRQRVQQLVAAGELAAIATPIGHLVRGSSVLARIQTQSLRSRTNG